MFSLGVLLYELVAGRAPFEIADTDLLKTAQIVCEQDPQRPSALVERLSRRERAPSSDRSDSVAARRGTSAKRLAKRLEGDLDAIILKALRKEPERRYASVEAMRQDLQRHRDSLPIAARPDSVSYRVRKLLARHPLPVFGSLALVVTLIGGLAATSWQASIAAAEREEARAALATSDTVERFLSSMLLAASPREAGQSVTMREAIDRAAERIDAELGGEPVVEARVREVIGGTYRTLGDYDKADVQLTRANELAAEVLTDSTDAARIAHELAILRYDQGRKDEALALAYDALAARETHLSAAHDMTLDTRLLIGRIELSSAPEVTIEQTTIVADTIRDTRPDGDPRASEAENLLGKAYIVTERYEEAITLLRQVYDVQLASYGEGHPETLITANDLGIALSRSGQPEESLVWQQRALQGLVEQFPPGSIDVVIPRINMARVFLRLERAADAKALLETTLSDGVPSLGDDHYVIAVARVTLAQSLAELGSVDESRAQYERAHTVLVEQLGPEHAYTKLARDGLSALQAANDVEG